METPEQEILLLKQLRTSDAVAFRKLFDAYYKYLTVTAYRYLNDADKAKDMAHDAFVALWDRRESLEIKSGLKAYLRQIVVNKCLNHIKREKRIDFSEPAKMPEMSVEATAQTQIEANDLQTIVQEAVDGLPDRCRIIFSMSRFEEKSHKEIAELLGISTKTIENQITRALKVIRAAITTHTLSILYIINIFFQIL